MLFTGRKLIFNSLYFLLFTFYFLLVSSCSFDYGNKETADSDQPDIVMENVEYVRVRGGDPQVRFVAEFAERYEERQIMNLRNFAFEQFGNDGEEVNASGSAGAATVELDTGNIGLGGGVRIDIDSEDIIIETEMLDWNDKERSLTGAPEGEVEIYRSDGTNFLGRGFSANSRSRTWEFTSGVSGSYTETEDGETGEGIIDEVIDTIYSTIGISEADE
jgi:LPS export ABC transporter protein LptC